jgi:hypothetical protein
MEDLAKIVVFVDGRMCTMLTSMKMATDGGQVESYTTEAGLAGFTPGPGKVEISLSYTVSVGGFEEPFQKYVADGAYHVLQVGIGPHKYVGNGKFRTDDLGMSVGAATEGSVTWTGQKSAME